MQMRLLLIYAHHVAFIFNSLYADDMPVRSNAYSHGLTIIELLVVMAVIALLAIAVIVMLQPLEQMKKTRDKRRMSEARELLISYDRYLTAFQKYPWEEPGVLVQPSVISAIIPDFSSPSADHYYVVERGELKPSFVGRKSIVDGDFYVSLSVENFPSICFEPESNQGRNMGLAPIKTKFNTPPSPAHDCNDAFGTSSQCYVCLPF
jgi:prepilin-type N-terminal cleavage/methylation domain-containing protein